MQCCEVRYYTKDDKKAKTTIKVQYVRAPVPHQRYEYLCNTQISGGGGGIIGTRTLRDCVGKSIVPRYAPVIFP